MNYIDIGLNLFCKQFRDPNKIITDAAAELACTTNNRCVKKLC